MTLKKNYKTFNRRRNPADYTQQKFGDWFSLKLKGADADKVKRTDLVKYLSKELGRKITHTMVRAWYRGIDMPKYMHRFVDFELLFCIDDLD